MRLWIGDYGEGSRKRQRGLETLARVAPIEGGVDFLHHAEKVQMRHQDPTFVYVQTERQAQWPMRAAQ